MVFWDNLRSKWEHDPAVGDVKKRKGYLVGGSFNPSEKSWSEFVSWDDFHSQPNGKSSIKIH